MQKEYISSLLCIIGSIQALERTAFMKKRSIFLITVFALILFASCTPKPSMEDLLSYQRPGTEMSLRITDAETFLATLYILENETVLTFTDEKREGISYRIDRDGNIQMSYDNVSIPIDPSDELKCKKWFSLFSITPGETIWRIKRETAGGLALFTCSDGKITLRIDESTALPLRIETKSITVDVLSCKTKQ